jgi:hypothetical protein
LTNSAWQVDTSDSLELTRYTDQNSFSDLISRESMIHIDSEKLTEVLVLANVIKLKLINKIFDFCLAKTSVSPG